MVALRVKSPFHKEIHECVETVKLVYPEWSGRTIGASEKLRARLVGIWERHNVPLVDRIEVNARDRPVVVSRNAMDVINAFVSMMEFKALKQSLGATSLSDVERILAAAASPADQAGTSTDTTSSREAVADQTPTKTAESSAPSAIDSPMSTGPASSSSSLAQNGEEKVRKDLD